MYACVRILSESIASLPIELMQRKGTKTVNVLDHPAVSLLAEPNEWMTCHDLMQFWVAHSELRGNAYAFKVKDGTGRVRQLLPLTPDQVGAVQNSDWSIDYTVGTDKQIAGVYNAQRVLHLRNFGTDGWMGLSTVTLHRDEIGLAMQTQKHGAVLFKNGAQIGKVVEHPAQLGEQAYARLKESIQKTYTGADNAHKTLILEEGMKLSTVGMTNEDAQFLDTRRFSKQEIASIFGVPMFLLNDTEKSTTWGSGLEQISRAFLNYTLKPRLDRITKTLARELLTPEERKTHFFRFDVDEFTLGDMSARFSAYKTGVEGKIITPNEARSWEGLDPIDGGDEFPEAPKPAVQEGVKVYNLPEERRPVRMIRDRDGSVRVEPV